jgi:hypothetical protein
LVVLQLFVALPLFVVLPLLVVVQLLVALVFWFAFQLAEFLWHSP